MNNKAIGVMDSGVGGLTVVKELIRQLPKEKIIYFGDSVRCPYGERSTEEVIHFTEEIFQFLSRKDIKVFIIACNTATAAAISKIREMTDIPVIGVIMPGSRRALQISNNNDIVVLSTRGTKNSHKYKSTIQKINDHANVLEIACPKFVPLIESGDYKNKKIRDKVIDETLSNLKRTSSDTVILGCTHYPLISNYINEYFNNEKNIVDSGFETARDVSTLLEFKKLLSNRKGEVIHDIYIHGDYKQFEQILNEWMPNFKYTIQSVEL